MVFVPILAMVSVVLIHCIWQCSHGWNLHRMMLTCSYGPFPDNAIPITNKWVFVKKWSKEGEVMKYVPSMTGSKRLCTMTRIWLQGNILTSCKNGHITCNPSPGPIKKTEVATNGCEGSLPQWHFKRNYIHAVTRHQENDIYLMPPYMGQ